MRLFPKQKALVNERKYSNIVKLAFPADGLEFEFNRRIIEFHKRRHIQPRRGRQIVREKRAYSRWCFEDLGTACDFIEQFGGALAEIQNG
jgi:hypothetical protein